MTIDPVSIGISLALSAASMAMQAMRRIEGPRLEDTKFNAADYGGLLTRFWGTRWIVPKVIFGEDLRHEEVTNKTKGGKYNQHKYYGTWAVEIASHPIDAVTRVKMDGHLVLDLTGAGPVTPFDLGGGSTGKFGAAAGAGQFSDYFNVMTGAPGQEPDERMLATVEAINGVGSCPDYRGRALAAIKELPLEKFGNRIPQIEIEGVTAVAAAHPYESLACAVTGPVNLLGFSFSPDTALACWGTSGEFELWDMLAREPLASGVLPLDFDGNTFARTGGLSSDGRIWLVGSYSSPVTGHTMCVLYTTMADGSVGFQQVVDSAVFDESFSWAPDDEPGVFRAANGKEYVLVCGETLQTWVIVQATIGGTADYIDVGFVPTGAFTDAWGDIWVCGGPTGGGATQCSFRRVVRAGDSPIAGDLIVATGLAAGVGVAGPDAYACHYRDDTADHFVLSWEGGHMYTVDTATGAVTHSLAISTLGAATPKRFRLQPPGAGSIWIDNQEIACADLAVLRTVDADDWDGGGSASFGQAVFNPVLNAMVGGNTTHAEFFYLDRVGQGGVTLRTVVEDTCELAGMDLATVDATALTQEIAGYSVAGGNGKDWIEPLLDLYDVDARPHGFKLQFVPRGGAAGASLSSEDFAAAEDGEPPFAFTRAGATDVPAYLALQFADTATDQQRNSTLSGPRGKADGVKPATIDMTSLVLAADAAQQLGQRLHRRIAWDAGGIEFALPSRQIALEPGDVHPLDLRGQSVRARLVSIEMRADRRFATEWKRDDASVAVLSGAEGAVADGNAGQAIVVPGLAKGFVLDLPLLRDIDENANPAVYLAAGPYSAASTFPGATVFQAVDGEFTEQLGAIETGNRATWGFATAALGDVDSPWVWDRGHTLNVMLQVGSLTGTTEAALDANPMLNLLLVGSEILQFTTATLELDGSYTLSGFKRGRRGTEWATGLHAERDVVVLLDKVGIQAMGLSEVGTDLAFKAVTNGRSLSGAFQIDLAPFTGASLKPYAPCHLRGTRDFGTNAWALSWVRRTRVGGAWTSGAPIALGEASEAYEIEILDGADVVRTVTGLGSAAWTYSSADQVTDFGANQSAVTFRAYQISDAVGRGFAAEATV